MQGRICGTLKLSKAWMDTLRRLMIENAKIGSKARYTALRRKKVAKRNVPYLPPPPVVEYLRKRNDFLSISAYYPYQHGGIVYRSLYHAILSALADRSRTPNLEETLEYATFNDLRIIRKRGEILLLPLDEEKAVKAIVEILLERFTIYEEARKLIMATGESDVRPIIRITDGRILGYLFGEGLNLYGKAIMEVRSIVANVYPELIAEYRIRLNNAIKGYKRVPFFEYYTGLAKAEDFTVSQCRKHDEKRKSRSIRMFANPRKADNE